MRRTEAWAVLMLACACGFAVAAPPVLQDIVRRLPEHERAQLLERQQALAALSPAQRTALLERVAAWDALPDAERDGRREAWQAWHALPQGERTRMRAARAAYEALPPERRQDLREQFDALDANLRRGWLLGPAIGADWPRLHALLSQAPAAEHDALLSALHALSTQGRRDLAVLAQRTPPEERDALREALLAQPTPSRDAWLRRRVDP